MRTQTIGVVVVVLSIVFLSASALPTPTFPKDKPVKPVLRSYYTPDHYPSYQEITQTLHQIAQDHPDICKVFSIGQTWGWNPSTGQYDWPKEIWTIKISDNPYVNETSTEASIFIHWHHAREWIDPAFMMYLIDKLVNGYYTNDTIHWIVDHFEIFIAPLSNADGYVVDGNGNLQNLSGGFGPGGWRKNCRDNDGDGTFEISSQWGATGEGVDPERNWDWHWEDGNDDPDAADYHGPYPFSEPLVQAEKEFMESYDIDAQCVLHSFSAVILIPWFYTSENCPHDSFYRDFANHMALRTKIEGDPSNHFGYGRPDETIGYSAPGGSSDWVYGALNKIGIAIEMEPSGINYFEDGFHPSTDKIATYCDDLYEAMIYFLEIADTKLKPPSEAGNQPNAYIVWGYVKDSQGNPLSGVTVSIRNTANGDVITTKTDENGFYMLNLGTLNNSYDSNTQFEISVGSVAQQFTPSNAMGSERIDLTGVVPTIAPNYTFIIIVLGILIAISFAKEERENEVS